MKIKTSELTRQALDWAVAKCEGTGTYFDDKDIERVTPLDGYSPSTDWAQGGPIIEREKIVIGYCAQEGKQSLGVYADIEWDARASRATVLDKVGPCFMYGPTPLIAAMRCYVASKLGEEIDVPDELTNGAST